MKHKTLAGLYRELEMVRWQFFFQGHKSSVLTIPSILPMDGQDRTNLPHNFQSIGARGVNNMSSRLALALFPPTQPFMRLEISPADRAGLAGNTAVLTEVQNSLLAIEEQAVSEFDTEGWRPVMASAMRLLVCTGNALVYDRATPDARPSVHDMRSYVVDRDPEGNVLTVILRQQIGVSAAQTALKAVAQTEAFEKMVAVNSGVSSTHEPTIELFTGARRTDEGRYEYWQEIAGMEVPDSRTVKHAKDLPLLPLRFEPIEGTGYGRGYVEDYHGDLLALEHLSRALVEGATALAKIVWLIKPGSSTKAQTLAKAANGSIHQGNGEDVSTLQADKASDLSIALAMVDRISQRLSSNFLLTSSIQRNGERVTAEEIRLLAQELEDALGSVYSSLADNVQRPLVDYLYNRMQRRGRLEGVPSTVRPVVASGLENISRNHKVARIQEFLGTLNQLFGPDQIATIVKVEEVAADLAAGLNLDVTRYILSEEEIAQNRLEQQQQQAVEALGPQVVKQMGSQQPTQ